MIFKVKLKNADNSVLLDPDVYEYLSNHAYYSKVKLLENLRKHSSGCAVFQKTWKKAEGGYKTETIYLHKKIAEQYLVGTKSTGKNLVGAKNGNKLDCRLENLVYRSRSVASRKRKTSSKVGYTGVYKHRRKYIATARVNGVKKYLGLFNTPIEAHNAYKTAIL